LDTADEKASDADLQSLTRQVGDAFQAKAKEAGTKRVLDFGIVEGLSDLKNQIGSDLKDLGGSKTWAADFFEKEAAGEREDDAEARLAALRERVAELEKKEAETLETRSRLEERLEEVLLAIQAEPEEEEAPEDFGSLEAMRNEFSQLQAAGTDRQKALLDATAEAAAGNEHLAQQMDFWRDKAKQLLASLGFNAVPEEIQALIHEEEEEEDEANGSEKAGSPNGDSQLSKDCDAQRQTVQDLEATLADLMRGSEEVMGRVELRRRGEKDLAAKLSAAEAQTAAEAEAERTLQHQLMAAHEKVKPPVQALEVDRAAEEKLQLRAEVGLLKQKSEAMRQETAALEAQLRKQRAAAAADLERAVPSSSSWSCLDEPLMKLVTLLVKSTCLRRAIALHLLATYLWLFFLVFWLEKHP